MDLAAEQRLLATIKQRMLELEKLEGIGHTFSTEMDATWNATMRPLVEAFFHVRFMLEMAIKYGRELDTPPQPMPSGWAALLYLYNLR